MKRTSPYQIDVLRRVAAGDVLCRAPHGSGPPSWYWEGGPTADHYACNGAIHRKVPLLGFAEGSSIALLTEAGRAFLAETQAALAAAKEGTL